MCPDQDSIHDMRMTVYIRPNGQAGDSTYKKIPYRRLPVYFLQDGVQSQEFMHTDFMGDDTGVLDLDALVGSSRNW
jgi:hypothetical protein